MNVALSRSEGAPLHHQIMVVLRSQIHAGQLANGAVIPSETSLMEQYGVSRATVRRALQTLEDEGLIERHQGKGTRVTYEPRPAHSGIAHDIHRIETIAAKTTVVVTAFEWALPTPAAQAALATSPGEEALRVVRVRSARSGPLRYIVNFLPPHIGEKMRRSQFEKMTLLAILANLGHEIERFEDGIGAIAADPELARHLRVKIGSPLIELHRDIYSSGATPVAYQWTAIPPARGLLRTQIHPERD